MNNTTTPTYPRWVMHGDMLLLYLTALDEKSGKRSGEVSDTHGWWTEAAGKYVRRGSATRDAGMDAVEGVIREVGRIGVNAVVTRPDLSGYVRVIPDRAGLWYRGGRIESVVKDGHRLVCRGGQDLLGRSEFERVDSLLGWRCPVPTAEEVAAEAARLVSYRNALERIVAVAGDEEVLRIAHDALIGSPR